MSACITASTDNMKLLACHHELLMVFQLNVHNYCMQLKNTRWAKRIHAELYAFLPLYSRRNEYIYLYNRTLGFWVKVTLQKPQAEILKVMYLKTLIIFTLCMCVCVCVYAYVCVRVHVSSDI